MVGKGVGVAVGGNQITVLVGAGVSVAGWVAGGGGSDAATGKQPVTPITVNKRMGSLIFNPERREILLQRVSSLVSFDNVRN